MSDAWQKAQGTARLLPRTATWSFTITDLADDAAFNIYAPAELWSALRTLLHLTQCEPTEQGAGYMTWYTEGFALSLIQPEETDGPESGHDASLDG